LWRENKEGGREKKERRGKRGGKKEGERERLALLTHNLK